MKNKKTIALDVDGVILDFYKHMCDFLNRPMEILSSWSIDYINDNFHLILDDKEFWRTLPSITKPNEIPFEFDYYVTALPPHQRDSRILNLLSLGYPQKDVIVCDNKHETCKRLGIDILVDDKPSTIETCREHGINAIFFRPYYMNKDFHNELNPCETMDEVVKQFDNSY